MGVRGGSCGIADCFWVGGGSYGIADCFWVRDGSCGIADCFGVGGGSCVIALSVSTHTHTLIRSDVSLGSQCGCQLRLFIECVCVWSTKALTMPAYCIAANCSNHKQPKA